MNVIEARRIVHFVDDLHMSMERLASQLECTEPEAQLVYAQAKSIALTADARNAVSELMRLAHEFNTTADELIRMYA